MENLCFQISVYLPFSLTCAITLKGLNVTAVWLTKFKLYALISTISIYDLRFISDQMSNY